MIDRLSTERIPSMMERTSISGMPPTCPSLIELLIQLNENKRDTFFPKHIDCSDSKVKLSYRNNAGKPCAHGDCTEKRHTNKDGVVIASRCTKHHLAFQQVQRDRMKAEKLARFNRGSK